MTIHAVVKKKCHAYIHVFAQAIVFYGLRIIPWQINKMILDMESQLLFATINHTYICTLTLTNTCTSIIPTTLLLSIHNTNKNICTHEEHRYIFMFMHFVASCPSLLFLHWHTRVQSTSTQQTRNRYSIPYCHPLFSIYLYMYISLNIYIYKRSYYRHDILACLNELSRLKTHMEYVPTSYFNMSDLI